MISYKPNIVLKQGFGKGFLTLAINLIKENAKISYGKQFGNNSNNNNNNNNNDEKEEKKKIATLILHYQCDMIFWMN